MIQLVDWIAILTIPVALLIWVIGNIKINNDSMRDLNELYKSDRSLYLRRLD
jgi:hypothetical protein